jgi:hypothetical protein
MTIEQEIRVKILPQLNRLSDKLWETGSGGGFFSKKVDKIIKDLRNILDENDD